MAASGRQDRGPTAIKRAWAGLSAPRQEVHGRDGHLGGWGGTPRRSLPAAASQGTSLAVMAVADTVSVAVVAAAVLDGSCGQVEASELVASGERGHSYWGRGFRRCGRGRGCLRP